MEIRESRDQEHHLRNQAQARANVSRAAFLLGEGQIEEADRLIQANPLESIEPSREAAVVLRALGGWYATYGRWRDSVHCYLLMNQANRMNASGEILRSSELLVSAAAFVELGAVEAMTLSGGMPSPAMRPPPARWWRRSTC